ncbi:hypothetical protein PHYPO_G00077110 [Pangasianodon hypophthalmus]|uniref:Ig-like domain-containing protein n=1 Tax=Pangasianodon hypophthalmus TaxID=310915 RepID=A0A5N5LKL9_PANHP|nr:immunoglobulin superfamily member 5 [Pangasianodon hypophthalmus]KAB5543265.1 hypothetical protein PHYPO_G00077110 [Pangasianodon hypophthalmus]
MDTFTLAAVLLFITGGVSAQVLQPINETVLQNSEARFNCSINTAGWTVMTWTVNERLALSISESSGPIGSHIRYFATNYSTAGQYKWEFLIKGVTTADAGRVGCQVQGSLPVSATLTVQQNGTVAIMGSNRTATEGDQVTFQCLAVGWLPAAQLSWAVNGIPVDKGVNNTSPVADGILMNSNSTLKITATSNASVDCLASISSLPSPEISTVFLTVQKAVPPPRRDQTVLIAITVAFSLAALLVLLIIGIIFCCKRQRRKRSSYQDQMRAHTLSHRQQAAYPERGQVWHNIGFTEERPRADNNDGVYTISGFQQSNYINNIQLPEVNPNQYVDSSTYDGYSLDDPGLKKHRHLTIV